MTTLTEMSYINWVILIVIGMLLMIYAIFFSGKMAFEQKIMAAALLVACSTVAIVMALAHYNRYPDYQDILMLFAIASFVIWFIGIIIFRFYSSRRF
jgi:uncharacterized membrane protein YfcA